MGLQNRRCARRLFALLLEECDLELNDFETKVFDSLKDCLERASGDSRRAGAGLGKTPAGLEKSSAVLLSGAGSAASCGEAGLSLGNGTFPRIGAAVSGGADSVSLLIALSKICGELKIPLFVVTVNHNIRPDAETRGDAEFVKDLCKRLGGDCGVTGISMVNVEACEASGEGAAATAAATATATATNAVASSCQIIFKCVTFEAGQVVALAKERGGGIEEAARFLRYQAFETFIAENNLDLLCLAHNQNDNLETLLMRFLKGAGLDGSFGIQKVRGKIARPLLDIGRAEIEEYLTSQGFSWRTDSTNSNTEYFRNKIRLKLTPFLDENFPGWERCLLSGAQKSLEDSEVLQSIIESFPFETDEKDDGCVISFSLDAFNRNLPAVKKRILLKACNICGENGRIPSAFLDEVCSWLSGGGAGAGQKSYGKCEISAKKGKVFIKKLIKKHTDSVFFGIIEESGVYDFPFGTLYVEKSHGAEEDGLVLQANGVSLNLPLSFPFCIRNARFGDKVLTSGGGVKKVSEVFSDWKVSEADRPLIPLIQPLGFEPDLVTCIFGSCLGYKK